MRAIIIITAIAAALAVPAHAQQTSFTDSTGRYYGSAIRHDNATSFTNSSGQFSGSAITHGNKTDYYDARAGAIRERPQGPRRPSARVQKTPVFFRLADAGCLRAARSSTIIDLSPNFHPGMDRVLTTFEPCWLGGATGRGAEPLV
jgi:hypothetical protein